MAELIFGKYEKIRRLAQGGMGDVFLGRQSSKVKGFDRLVILKSLRDDLAAEEGFVEQFLDEARVAANLNHPNVVSIYEVGEWEGVYFIAMEYIAGEDLSRLWYASAKKGLGLPFSVTVKIIHDACLGLDHAHKARDVHGKPLHIVHRDISPQNIMVRGDGVTKVVDFGIAKATNRVSQTQVGTVKGKLQYMSPEQVKGEPLDGRSDTFSLGIVLWEMCTGKRLFKAETELETLNKILTHPIPPPSSIVKNFPAELEAVIEKLLERDRDERYKSCAEAAADLAAYLERSNKAKAVSVADFVHEVLGDTLQERTKDLTPDAPADPEETVATTEGEPVAEQEWDRIIVERARGGLHRFDSIDEVLAQVSAGQLGPDDKLQLGPKKVMRLDEHPKVAPALRALEAEQDQTGAWVAEPASVRGAASKPAPLAEPGPAPRTPAPAPSPSSTATPSPPAMPSPDAMPAPDEPAPAPAAASLLNVPQPEAPYQLGPLGPAAAPHGGPTGAPWAGPVPYASGSMPRVTGPWGPAAPPYQMPTSPPGYPAHYPTGPGLPEGWVTPTTGGQDLGGSAQVPVEELLPRRRTGLWVSLALLLVVAGAPLGLYYADRPTFEQLKARVLPSESEPTGLGPDALRAAILSDDERALGDALAAVEPLTKAASEKTRARAAAASALLHAGLAQIELERARLYDLTGGDDDKAAARVQAAESAADEHRVAAYKGATTARSLAGQLREAHVAMAAYQGLRGAAQEMEADFEAALRVAEPGELSWLQVESLGLRALLEARRALAGEGGEGTDRAGVLRRALKDVRVAREAAARARPPIDDRRLAYAEAAVLVELADLGDADGEAARGLVASQARARPTSVRLRLLEERLGDEGKAEAKPTEGAAADDEPEKKKRSLGYAELKRLADKKRDRGQTYQAARLYRKAIGERSTPSAWTGLGWAYLDLERNDKAIDAFERALRIRDDYPLAILGQAEALRYSGRRSAAVRAFKRYLEIAPDGEEAAMVRNALEALGE